MERGRGMGRGTGDVEDAGAAAEGGRDGRGQDKNQKNRPKEDKKRRTEGRENRRSMQPFATHSTQLGVNRHLSSFSSSFPFFSPRSGPRSSKGALGGMVQTPQESRRRVHRRGHIQFPGSDLKSTFALPLSGLFLLIVWEDPLRT